MDFDLPRDLADWQRRVRAFVAAELTPHDEAIEKTGVIPPSALDGLRRMGLYGLNTPKHYGGLGLTMLGTCLALQELAKAHIAYYYVSGVNVHIGSKGIEFDGTEAQRRRWLPELASGRIVASFALTEPGAGSDAGGIATTAVRDGGPTSSTAARSTSPTHRSPASSPCSRARTPTIPGAPSRRSWWRRARPDSRSARRPRCWPATAPATPR